MKRIAFNSAFRRLRRSVGFVAVAGFLLIVCTTAKATVVYSYTGLEFTNYSGADNSSRQVNISASVTLPSALGANFQGAVTPESWEISDSWTTLTNVSTNIAQPSFDFQTDSTGQITGWAVEVDVTSSAPDFIRLLTQFGSDDSVMCGGTNLSFCNPVLGDASVGYPNNAPNFVTTTQPQPEWLLATASSVPEPGTLVLLGVATLAAAALRKRGRLKV